MGEADVRRAERRSGFDIGAGLFDDRVEGDVEQRVPGAAQLRFGRGRCVGAAWTQSHSTVKGQPFVSWEDLASRASQPRGGYESIQACG